MPYLASASARRHLSPGYHRAAVFSPASIAGLEVWYEADRLALADTDPVATWPDLSGNGNDAVDGTDTTPLFQASVPAFNDLPTVLFNTDTDRLDATTFTLSQPLTYFVVAPNDGPPRQGTLTIAGLTFTAVQEGASSGP